MKNKILVNRSALQLIMKIKHVKYYFLFVFSLSISAAYSQIEETGLSQDSTLIGSNIEYADNVPRNENGFFSMFEGNPGRAALYSAIIPGGGQVYNKKWIKVPIVLGLEGTAIGFIVFFNDFHKTLDLGFKGLVRGEIDQFGGYTPANVAGLKQRRDTIKQYRDYSIIALAVAHVLNIADAFVDRHLMEFDVDEDISFHLGPTTHGVGLSMSF